METTIFQFMGESLNNAVATYVTDTATRIISDFRPVAILGVGLFITCYGYLVLSGRVQEPFVDFISKCVKIIIIASLALNTDTYLNWVVSAINGLQSGLSDALSQGNGAQNIYQILDGALDKSLSIMSTCIEHVKTSGFLNIGDSIVWLIEAGLISASTIVLVVTGGLIVMVASIMLKIMLGIGPVFIMCLMWPLTSRFFDAWFGQVMTYALKTVFVIVVMSFAIKIFDRIIGGIDSNGDFEETRMLMMMVETAIGGFLLYRIVLEVGSMSASLAGGISAATMSFGHIFNTTRNAGRAAGSAGKLLAKGAGAVGTGAGSLINSARKAVTGGGAPAYQRKLMENLKSGFGSKK